MKAIIRNDRIMTPIMVVVAIGAGALVNYLGDRLLNVRLELFWGVNTFSVWWVLDLFLVPFIAGLTVSLIYGLGGKLLCYFAPIVTRVISYVEIHYYADLPDGVFILPIYYWVMVLIVAIEAAAFGGVFGEVLIKRTYGRRPRHLVYKSSADNKSPNTRN